MYLYLCIWSHHTGYQRVKVDACKRFCKQPKCANNDENSAVKTYDVENEFHFLIKCKQYDHLRTVLFSWFCYMLTRTHIARIVRQFIVDAFDSRPVSQ